MMRVVLVVLFALAVGGIASVLFPAPVAVVVFLFALGSMLFVTA